MATSTSADSADNAARASSEGRFWGALRHRNFRHQWSAFIAASLGQRMDGVVTGWLVLELTNSPFLVGLIGALRFIGALLGPFTGVVADRCDRRRLLLVSVVAMTAIALLLFGLIALRRLEVWHLCVTATVWGILWAFYQPAQQSMQADVLSGRELVNGISLMNTAMNIMSIVGPALGGALLECCGPGWQSLEWTEADMLLALNKDDYQSGRIYAAADNGAVMSSRDQGMTWNPTPLSLPGETVRSITTAGAAAGVQWSYVVLLGLQVWQFMHYSAIRFTQRPAIVTHTSVWHNLLDGMRYSCANPGLWTALALAGMVNLAAFPLQFGLLPIFARDVFSVGAAGLGLLGAALGVGSLLGSFLMTAIGTLQRAGVLMLLGTFLWCLFLLIFALIPHYVTAVVVLVLMGIFQTMSLTNMTILLLGTSSSDMRGRVMGLRSLAVAPLFLGGTVAGASAASFGAPLTTVGCAIVGILITLWVAPWIPRTTQPQETRTAETPDKD